jgi:hypothetical protein
MINKTLRNTLTIATFVTMFLCMQSESVVHAQDSIDDIIPDFSPEQQSALSKEFGLFTSAVTVFTGLNSVSGGNFTFDSPRGRDTTLDTFRIPYTHTYGNEKDTWRPFVNVIAAQSNLRQSNSDYSDVLKEEALNLPDEINALPNNPDFVKTDSSSLSLGGGATYQPTEELSITSSMDFIWTHIKRRYDYNNFLSALIGQKYDRDLFNTSLEAIAYAPSIKVAYRIGCEEDFNVTPSAHFTYLSSYDMWSKSRYSDFSSDSTVLFTSLDLKIPTPVTAFGASMKVNPFINRTDLGLAAQNGVGLWYFYDVGTNVTFDLKGKSDWISSLRLGASYSFGDDFSGYRIGAGVEL